MTAVPSNWSQLRAAHKDQLDKILARLRFEAELAEGVVDRELPILTGAFSGSAEYLAEVFVIDGADRARTANNLPRETLPALLGHGDEPVKEATAAAIGTLSYIALLRCLSVALPTTANGVEARWLRVAARQRRDLNDADIRTAALAAVAVGEVDLVRQFAGGGPLKARRTPREIAGPNVAGFTRHLAEVIKGGGGRDAVEEPWWSLLRMFPLTLASNGVQWVDLVWAAMAMMVQFEKQPAAEVGTWLPKLVADLD
jgi:hypothetical protein